MQVYVSAILEFNMAAITATSSGSYEIPWPLKCGVSNSDKQNVSICLSFGVIAENKSKMAAILNCKMAATRGREYVRDIFPSSPWVGLLMCKVSCMLQKVNDLLCHSTLAVISLANCSDENYSLNFMNCTWLFAQLSRSQPILLLMIVISSVLCAFLIFCPCDSANNQLVFKTKASKYLGNITAEAKSENDSKS